MDKFDALSLKALYIFSVAAEFKNFSKTAEKLRITPSAVSHQIKRLEDSLCCKLFIKENSHLALTQDAERYCTKIQHAFSQMRAATNELTEIKNNIIHLGVESSFAVKCLTPFLGLWQNDNASVDLRLRMINCDEKASELGLDVILGGKVENNFYQSSLIAEETYYPVCGREMYNSLPHDKSALITRIDNFLDLDNVDGWQAWAKTGDHAIPKLSKTIYFSHTLLLIQATLANQGASLLEKQLIENDLKAGQLVLLDKNGFTPEGSGYYISSLKRQQNNINIQNLESWLTDLFHT